MPGDDIDIDVLLILASIMVINFVMMRQSFVQKIVAGLQSYIRRDLDRGFWCVAAVAFVASPFITNDGLCLLLVDPVLDAFVTEAPPPSSATPLTSVPPVSLLAHCDADLDDTDVGLTKQPAGQKGLQADDENADIPPLPYPSSPTLSRRYIMRIAITAAAMAANHTKPLALFV